MQKSIKLAISCILVGTIGMASIPASYASSAIARGQKTIVGATGHPLLVAKAKQKKKRVRGAKRVRRVRTMKKR
jgi:peroxiredoxin family protein